MFDGDVVPASQPRSDKPKPITAASTSKIKAKEKEKTFARGKDEALEEESTIDDPLNRRKLQEEADLDNAKDVFAGTTSTLQKGETLSLDTFQPKTATDFDDYANALGEKFKTFQNHKQYPAFVKLLVKNAIAALDVEDLKAVSATVTVASNEKIKQEREAEKGKKKVSTKKTVNLDNPLRGDYDDFM
jgi:translation initiation factor 3 subunit J